jgi:hypothetical protein
VRRVALGKTEFSRIFQLVLLESIPQTQDRSLGHPSSDERVIVHVPFIRFSIVKAKNSPCETHSCPSFKEPRSGQQLC